MIKTLLTNLSNGDTTATALCADALKKAQNGRAFISLFAKQALQYSKALQERINKKDSAPLLGIPIAVKDNILYKDHKTTCGSEMLKDFVPSYSATALEKLLKSGANIIGKTNMDEFAMGSHSDTSVFSRVLNPYNENYSAGGSSGGSAAAVAMGAVSAALGSDTGGSVRLPASYCGVCGFRPSYGTVSRHGLVAFSSGMDTIGTLGVTPRDCARIFKVIAGVDPLDSTNNQIPKPDRKLHLKDCRVGSFLEELRPETDSDVYECVRHAADIFKNTEELSLPLSQWIVAAYYILSSAEAAANLSRYQGFRYGLSAQDPDFYDNLIKTRTVGFGKEVKRRILLGNYCLSAGYYKGYYLKARNVRAALTLKIDELLNRYDLLLLPTAPHRVPDLTKPRKFVGSYSDDKFCAVASLCGIPAVSLPVGTDKNGLPVGLSICGRRYDDYTLLSIAGQLYDALKKEGVMR